MSNARTQYEEALEASDLIGTAADMIAEVAKLLDKVPSRFSPELEVIDGQSVIDAALAKALSRLADRISLDAEYAAERAA